MTRRAIVLDANILIRAVLGVRVRELITNHVADVSFFAPDTAYAEAREYLPALLEKRGVNGAAGLAMLGALESVVRSRRGRVVSTAGAASAGAHQRTRSGRLASTGLRPHAGLPGVDRRRRFFWHRRCHLDHQPRETVLGPCRAY